MSAAISIQETAAGRVPVGNFVISSDLSTVANLELFSIKEFAISVNGQAGKRYPLDSLLPQNSVVIPSLSPDGKTVGFVISEGRSKRALVNDTLGKPYTDIMTCIGSFCRPFVFGKEGSNYAYAAKSGKKWHVIHNGVEQPPYDNIGTDSLGHGFLPIQLSPDGRRIAYVAKKGLKYLVVLDGEEQKEYSKIERWLAFSPDSKRFVYVAHKGSSMVLVENGIEIGTHDSIGIGDKSTLLFSPDSKSLAYVAKDDGDTHLIVNGKPGRPTAKDGIDKVSFGPDGRIAYLARQGANLMLIHGEKEYLLRSGFGSKTTMEYTMMDIFHSADGSKIGLLWSPGSSFVYQVDGTIVSPGYREAREGFFNDAGELVQTGKMSRKEPWMLTIGTNSPTEGFASNPVISSTGEVSYIMQSPLGSQVVRGSRKSKIYEGIYAGSLTYSPNGKHLAYLVRDGSGHKLVVDETESQPYEKFTSASIPLTLFQSVTRYIVFDGNSSLRAAGVKDGQFVLLKLTIK